MKKRVSITLLVVMMLISTAIFADTEVIHDKSGANNIIPVEVSGVALKSAVINYAIEKPGRADQDDTNVDQYRGHADVTAEYLLENTSESIQHVTVAFVENDKDILNQVTVMGQVYEPMKIEVDRLTNFYEEGLSLHDEYNVTRGQIIDRILSSKNDGVTSYITGEWVHVYLIEMDLNPGQVGGFSIDYEEEFGIARRYHRATVSVPWAPEFYQYFEYYSYFESVGVISVTVHMPKDFVIEHTSYDNFENLAPDVYKLVIEGQPESNLIFTAHDPDNEPMDTGLEDTIANVTLAMIISVSVVVLLVLFVIFYMFIWPIIQKRLEAKAVERMKKAIEAPDERVEEESFEEEVMDTEATSEIGAQSLLDDIGDDQGIDLEDIREYEADNKVIDAIETVDQFHAEHETEVDTAEGESKKTGNQLGLFQKIVMLLKGLFNKGSEQGSLSDDDFEASLIDALEEDLGLKSSENEEMPSPSTDNQLSDEEPIEDLVDDEQLQQEVIEDALVIEDTLDEVESIMGESDSMDMDELVEAAEQLTHEPVLADEAVETPNEPMADEPVETPNEPMADEPVETSNESLADEPVETSNATKADETVEKPPGG